MSSAEKTVQDIEKIRDIFMKESFGEAPAAPPVQLLRALLDVESPSEAEGPMLTRSIAGASANVPLPEIGDANLMALYYLSDMDEAEAQKLLNGIVATSKSNDEKVNLLRYVCAQMGYQAGIGFSEKLLKGVPEGSPLATLVQEVLSRSAPDVMVASPKMALRDTVTLPEVAASTTVIIHGTWAKDATWWRNGGDFWTYINSITNDCYAGIDPFFWSGANKSAARLEGARNLKAWVEQHPTNYLRIIAHSHGGNVCFDASNLGLKIDHLITLGSPIRLDFIPNYNNITRLDNVFSTRDSVQTPPGTAGVARADGRAISEVGNTTNWWLPKIESWMGISAHSELHTQACWENNGIQGLLN